MGYYARGSGELKLHSEIPESVIEELEGFNDADQYTRGMNDGVKGQYLFLNHPSDRYFEHEIYDDLKKIEPYVAEGSIDFMGEDDFVWRFRFDPETKEFIEENGKITYEFDEKPVAKKFRGNNRLDFLNSIIEVFETFLDERGISIDNDEKLEDEDASNIYGTDYGDLESELESELIGWGVLDARTV